MSVGDPWSNVSASHVQWPYPYPTHYYGPPMMPGYYHFEPHDTFCPCCGKPKHTSPTNAPQRAEVTITIRPNGDG